MLEDGTLRQRLAQRTPRGALLCGRSDDAMTIGAALIVVAQT